MAELDRYGALRLRGHGPNLNPIESHGWLNGIGTNCLSPPTICIQSLYGTWNLNGTIDKLKI